MEEERAVSARVVEILLQDTWGDANYIGLTGLQVVGRGGVAVALTDAQLTATPRDLNEIPGNRYSKYSCTSKASKLSSSVHHHEAALERLSFDSVSLARGYLEV